MRSLESFRCELKTLLPHDSFLRVDRGQALFVSDAPRRHPEYKAIALEGFQIRAENDLLYITPIYDQAPESVTAVLTALLKSDSEQKDRIIRENLALNMRLKRQREIEFWKKMLSEGEKENEN